MRKISIVAALVAGLFSSTAFADWTGKDASNATITFVNPNTCTSVACVPIAALVTSAGATLYGTAGSSNAAVLSVQGIASGTPMPISGTVTATPTGTQAISAASASYASGAFASGAFASGSVASGAFASGSMASGSMAAGAMVDLLTMRGTVGAGTAAANSLLTGGIYNSTPITLTNGQGSAAQFDANGYLKVNIATGASSGAVAQGSTTSGQTGLLVQGAVTTAAPTYTTAQTSPLSLTTTGDLRVSVTNTNANGQAALASSSPVAVAKNSGTGSTVAGAAVGTAGTASAEVVTVQGIASMTPLLSRPSDGTRSGIIDPCEATLQSYAPISITTATTTRIVAPSASNKTYICHLFLTSAAADNVGIVEGTGGTCGTGTAGVIGGTTAANGPNFAANGGVALHAGGKVAVAQTAGTNVDLCLITSAATPLAGGIKYVQAP
jgi:hypothetical protein